MKKEVKHVPKDSFWKSQTDGRTRFILNKWAGKTGNTEQLDILDCDQKTITRMVPVAVFLNSVNTGELVMVN